MRIRRHISHISAVALAAIAAGCGLTPEAIDGEQLAEIVTDQAHRAIMDQEPLSGPVSLYEAMARALKYNLDYKVEMMQEQLRGGELIMASTELLPRAETTSEHKERNNYLMTGELDVPTGIEGEPEVISQDKKLDVADITFSWHILDFALSYVRARQAADQHLIAQEMKRKVIQRTLEDTRTAYWRAYSADKLIRKLRNLESRVQVAITNAQHLSKRGDMSPVTALTYERELIQIRLLAQKLDSDLSLAKSQLAALMDLPPGANFSLKGDATELPSPGVLAMSGKEMIEEALFNRAEIRELEYKRRINDADLAAALLELLPGLQVYTAENLNSNSFLLNADWSSWGVKAAWNLIKVAQVPAQYRAIEAEDGLIYQQSLAMTMVVMTQVYVSRIRYAHFVQELEIARNYDEVQKRLTDHVRVEAAAGRVSEQILIREEMNGLVAEVKHDIALANMHTGAANVFASLGLDLQASEVDHGLDVTTLSAHLKTLWGDRAAVSARGRYLLEIERQKAEARRVAEEEVRRAKQAAMYQAREEQLRRDQDMYDTWRRGGRGDDKAYGGKGSIKDGSVRRLKDASRLPTLK